ncbi:hypothetical protein L0660_22885 [Dyadobacter sp. CY351]|nr:hypothetical protein [Dyadobacter sp. CY351]
MLILATLLFGGLVHAQSNFTSKSIGVGVVVADMQRSLDFYIKGIGMVNTPTPLTKDSHFVLVQDPDGTFVELIGPM